MSEMWTQRHLAPRARLSSSKKPTTQAFMACVVSASFEGDDCGLCGPKQRTDCCDKPFHSARLSSLYLKSHTLGSCSDPRASSDPHPTLYDPTLIRPHPHPTPIHQLASEPYVPNCSSQSCRHPTRRIPTTAIPPAAIPIAPSLPLRLRPGISPGITRGSTPTPRSPTCIIAPLRLSSLAPPSKSRARLPAPGRPRRRPSS